MELVTSTGARIDVGRVDRRVLDSIDIQRPRPPLREAKSWGEIVEYVPLHNDSNYRRQLHDWRLRVFSEEWNVIASALTVHNFDTAEAEALHAVGMGDGTPVDGLRYTLTQSEQQQIITAVYYQSTVTERGIMEAEQRFAYTWRDKPLSAWSVTYSHGARGQLASHWRAALRSRLPWAEFCALPGPEQSTHVAFWNLEDRLNYLLQQNAN